ncbi:MAG TPA: Rieske 2Fe-2S domain-containing protein [Solirubrobacteraceae bacterium]|nr:Rieske 2Fe-2S domain-containing protein [Solirubrobacteraceae bacterium]
MPDRNRERKSKYTLDRNIPGAFEGETVTRRRLMVLGANGVGAVAAAAFTLPALGFAIAPIFKRQAWTWQAIGTPDDFNQSSYQTKVITITPGIGEAGNTIAYVRARDPSIDTEPEDQYNHWVALSDRCMHLGCPVRYVQAAERFICPCHGGVYDFRGMVAGGPPVRPLDRFYTRLNKYTNLVEIGPRFSVNSELQRFNPRFPGEPIDGIGQFLYPSTFDTAKRP